MNVTILLLTIWLTVNGQQAVTVRHVVAPSYEACLDDAPKITELQKEAGVEIAGKNYPVDVVSGLCLKLEKPRGI